MGIMKYENVCDGVFIERPNRFIAYVTVDGKRETVHVKNTGRCRELLLPGVSVLLEKASNPDRKTPYDLIGVWKANLGWVNIDSQAPNRVMKEWLALHDYDRIQPEYTYGRSRIDFYLEKRGEPDAPVERILLEVKGCTLEMDGEGYFPDAPMERGIKHLKELAAAVSQGYRCVLAFVIPMEGVRVVHANVATHPEFGTALQEAQAAGVEIWYLPCRVERDSLEITERIIAE